MKHKKRFMSLGIAATVVLLLTLAYFFTPATAFAGGTQPGSAADPLVTQRYVDNRIVELQEQITALQNQLAQMSASGTQTAPPTSTHEGQVVPFEPLFVPEGSMLVANAGVEFILRSGYAYVLAGENGLVDATAGRDVGNNEQISQNHLMLVPANGRGLVFETDAWLMIKGGFIVVN